MSKKRVQMIVPVVDDPPTQQDPIKKCKWNVGPIAMDAESEATAIEIPTLEVLLAEAGRLTAVLRAHLPICALLLDHEIEIAKARAEVDVADAVAIGDDGDGEGDAIVASYSSATSSSAARDPPSTALPALKTSYSSDEIAGGGSGGLKRTGSAKKLQALLDVVLPTRRRAAAASNRYTSAPEPEPAPRPRAPSHTLDEDLISSAVSTPLPSGDDKAAFFAASAAEAEPAEAAEVAPAITPGTALVCKKAALNK